MNNRYTALFLDSVKKMLASMPEADRAKAAVAITAMKEGYFKLVETKTLRAPIRELKIKKYRLIFFIQEEFLYFIHIFIKQSAKTPKKEIEYAEKVYKRIINNLMKK